MKIYIGNLSPSISDTDLQPLFERHGRVISLDLKMNQKTGDCRGFAFIEMEEAAAKAAIAELDGMVFQGKALRVDMLQGC